MYYFLNISQKSTYFFYRVIYPTSQNGEYADGHEKQKIIFYQDLIGVAARRNIVDK
jgi:hypothetical protein